MTYQQQIDSINKQLPQGQSYDRWYRGFEDMGVRVIAKDKYGREFRYHADVGNDGSITLGNAF